MAGVAATAPDPSIPGLPGIFTLLKARANTSSNTSARLVKSLQSWFQRPLPQPHGEYRLSDGKRADASYQKEGSCPTRVRPLPVRFIQALDTTAQGTTSRNIVISNLTRVAFFFLLRTGKYGKGDTNTAQHPFRIKDFQVFIGQKSYNAAMASKNVLTQADFVSILFTTQKNSVKG